jgi:phosphocarrier protein FPr
MVGIVIVSHSAKLAEGVRELAEQMTQGKAPLAVAAGIDDPENPIGTDAAKVQAAIESVYSEDGVVVLMDLGSALLSAEVALEFLTPEQQANVYLAAAPLVEGTLAAAVQASVGGNIEQVLHEARGALAVKVEQLRATTGAAAATENEAPTAVAHEAGQKIHLTVHNRLGLHARPAAQFVSKANEFQADISVGKGDRLVSAKSINQVATLGVRQGEEIVIKAIGPDAQAALVALQALADDNFGERDEAVAAEAAGPTKTETAEAGELAGIAASPGIAIGPAAHYRPRLPDVLVRQVTDPAAEWTRLQAAVTAGQQEIDALHNQTARQAGAAKAAIFMAHRLILQDPVLLDEVKASILTQAINAEAAWQQIIEETVAKYRALDDAYMRGRAADVLDVGQRVLRHLMGVALPPLELKEPSILIVSDLAPSDAARLDRRMVLGIGAEVGGATSHSAILARALNIPAVVGLGPDLRLVSEGQIVALDGGTGRMWLQPDADKVAALTRQQQVWLAGQQQARESSQQPAVTRDGRSMEIVANISGPEEAVIALTYGAEGVGLFRTEFLFMDRASAPLEEEQLAVYQQIAHLMGQRPLIIRTLDVGGDKPLPYFDLGREENPFLGWRGIRFCLDHPEIFKPQLRAILRASPGHHLKLMFPMISSIGELRAAKALLAQVQTELRGANIPFDEALEVGIMIEVPSAAVMAAQLAAEVDFFSIGTNDLSQYVMAADRGNARVAYLANALDPAVLRLIQQTAEAAHAVGIWIGLCGELAGNPLATPVLVGLGVDELSMSSPAIPAVKERIRQLTVDQARRMATEVLTLDSAEAVQQYLTAFQSQINP